MKKLIFVVALGGALYLFVHQPPGLRPVAGPTYEPVEVESSESLDHLLAVIDEGRSGTQVRGKGVVTRLLADDEKGSRHQRFILELQTGKTLLIAHNIDLAPRVASLESGDEVAFCGVYEWNSNGGVIHWTHRDPGGRHEGGWLKHAGRTFQ